MNKNKRKVLVGLRLAKAGMEVLIFFEGIAWDAVGGLRDARAWLAGWAHKRYAKQIKDSQNSHFRHDTTEIIES